MYFPLKSLQNQKFSDISGGKELINLLKFAYYWKWDLETIPKIHITKVAKKLQVLTWRLIQLNVIH